jgi:hypothetical protein
MQVLDLKNGIEDKLVILDPMIYTGRSHDAKAFV